MKPYDFISVKLCSALITGILIGRFLDISILSAFLLLGVSLLLVLLLYLTESYRTGIYFGVSILLATANLGTLAIILAQPKLWPDHYSKVVLSEDAIWELKLSKILKSTAFSDRYLFDVCAVNGKRSRGTLLASFKKTTHLRRYVVDDMLVYYGQVRPIHLPPIRTNSLMMPIWKHRGFMIRFY